MDLRPLITLLFCGTIFFLASCCTKKNCNSDEEIEEMYLKNFTAEQVDTIRIFAYVRNTGYTQVVDSLTVAGEPSDGRYVLRLHSFFSIHRDYKLRIPATGVTYTLSGFETSSEKCNFCFFTRDTYPRLAAYWMNGNRINSTRIELFP